MPEGRPLSARGRPRLAGRPLVAPTVSGIHLLVQDPVRRHSVQALLQPRRELVRVSPEEIRRASQDIQRRRARERAEERDRQRQEASRRARVSEDELARTNATIQKRRAEERLAAIQKRRAEERLRERAARSLVKAPNGLRPGRS